MNWESVGMLILGAIIAFVPSLAKDWLMENKKDKEKKKQFKREKLEEIFVLLDRVNQNAIKPIQFYDNEVDTAKLAMIIRFYFSDELYKNYQSFLNGYAEVTQVKVSVGNHMDIYMEKLSNNYRDFCNKIVLESEKYL